MGIITNSYDCSGSGKTTLALELGKILNLEVIHLDRLYWNPGWVSTPDDKWMEIVKNIIKKDRWVIEKNIYILKNHKEIADFLNKVRREH